MAVRLVDEGRLDEAIARLERGHAEAPDRSEVRQALAHVHELRGVGSAMAGRSAEGAADLEEATRLDPQSASAQLNLAVAYAQLGREDDARAHAREALRLRPDYAQAQGLLEKLGR